VISGRTEEELTKSAARGASIAGAVGAVAGIAGIVLIVIGALA
jgi:hypothetical protein